MRRTTPLLCAALVLLSASSHAQPKVVTWPGSSPGPPGLIHATVDAGADSGHRRINFMLEGLALPGAWEGWKASHASWTVIDEGERHAQARFATLEEAPGGRRVLMSLEAVWGEAGRLRGTLEEVASPRALARLPGACLPIPAASFSWQISSSTIGHDGELYSDSRRQTATTTRMVDLDGDGVLEAFVPVARWGKGPRQVADCPDDLRWDVWIVRGQCGHLVGRVEGETPAHDTWKTPIGPSGLRELVMESEQSSHTERLPRLDHFARRHRFNGKGYVKIGEKRSGGTCHHCASWWCQGPDTP